MRQIRRLGTDNPDFGAVVRQARIEANWKLNGRRVQHEVSATGSIDQRIRWFKMLNDDAYREEGRILDRVKLKLATERNQAVARTLENPLAQPRVPGLRRPALRSVDDIDEDAA